MKLLNKNRIASILAVCVGVSLAVSTIVIAAEPNQIFSAQKTEKINNGHLPGIVQVVTENGIREDRIGRPSNKTPGSEHEARRHAIQIGDVPTLDSAMFTPPSTIRVAIRANNDPNAPISSVITVPFDSTSNTTESYVKNVLPNEWYSTWNAETLKAGAMAVKMYGWYHTTAPKYPNYGADVDNTTNCQVYKSGGYAVASTSQAVDSIHGKGLCRSYKNIDYYLFETSYYDGTYGSSATDGEHMTQNGSHYWGDQGKLYDWIAKFYYDNSDMYTYEQIFSY